MNIQGYSDLHGRLKISDSAWEEEIKRLKHDIKKTEKRIIMTEKRRKLIDNASFDLDKDLSESMDSGNEFDDPYYSVNIERVMSERHLPSGGTKAFRVIGNQYADTDGIKTKAEVPEHGIWVSPTNVMRKRPKESNFEITNFPLFDLPRTELASPKRIRQNQQEWSSPHRVAEEPRPEDPHGNWVPAKAARQMPFQSHEVRDRRNRPFSQCTYTVRRSITPEVIPDPEERPPVKKISVLDDFEPEGSPTKRKPDPPPPPLVVPQPQPLHVVPSSDKIKRIVHPDGHIVKVSTLDDFESQRTEEKRSEVETADGQGRAGDAAEAKPLKKATLKKTVLSDIGKPLGPPQKSKIIRRVIEERKIPNSKDAKKEEDQNNKENKPRNGKLKDEEVPGEVDDVMTELKKILNDRKDGDDSSAKRKSSEKKRTGAEEKKAKTIEDEKKIEPAKKKREVDLKAVQKYIKTQKMRRMEQLKIEREKKAIEEEARKKKLEELRIRTMQLAATSKKKAPETTQVTSTIKIVEVETEEDATMSLGLKQAKPKVSYNESVSYLKRKPQAQQKPEPKKEPPVSKQPEEEKKEETVFVSSLPSSSPPRSPPKPSSPKISLDANTNLTLRKLAETLQLTMEQQKKAATPIIKEYREPEIPDSRSNRKVITVDVETIKSLKQDIKKISQNFQVLHEIITDKSAAVSPSKEIEPIQASSGVKQMALVPKSRSEGFPTLFKSTTLRPHPYNVLTAVRNKMKIGQRTLASSETSENTLGSERIKSDSESESVFVSTNQSTEEVASSNDVKTGKTSSEGNYYSLKEDSGSELSSSILDSEKDRFYYDREGLTKPTDSLRTDDSVKDSTSMSVDTASLSSKKLTSSIESLVLVPPDVQLTCSTLKGSTEKSDAKSLSTRSSPVISEVSKSESVPVEIEEIVTESIPENAVARVTEIVPRRFFNPEALHLQFQAELSLLETFQRSLAHFLEVERMKALSGGNVKEDKGVNTEDIIQEESLHEEETETVKTDLDIVRTQEETETDQKSTLTELISEQKSTDEAKAYAKEKLDLSDTATGISFQMLNRMMKDEELRSEHQLALIRLREKTLNEKVKAELTLLELRKKALKERGSSEDIAISAIKKKQRGILLKYQSEKEDIERLKKMHRIASEERKIMIKQQKQIRKMQLTTKDMLIKLKKREKSPQKRGPPKLKGSRVIDSQSEIQEEISVNASENTFTESITSVDESINHSIESDLDVSNLSEGDDEIFRRNMKTLEDKISKDKSTGEWKHAKRGHSAEELLKWTKRLEEKENRLKEMEKEAENLSVGAKHRSIMSLVDSKTSVRDRSTSPFQFQEVKEPSISQTEGIETKKSSSVTEVICTESKDVEESKKEPSKEKFSASEDIPEEFSKKTSITSRSMEYNSESFESSSDTHKSKAVATLENNSNNNGVMIKMALSPRVHTTRRRYSSGSDESVNLFHTETASEQSDVEIRVAALQEQLRRRKLEAERLRREQKKAHRERLKAKEQSLLKQIEAYDTYIKKKKEELEQEYERSGSFVKPRNSKDALQSKLSLRNGVSESDSEIAESIKTRTEEVSIREEIANDLKNKDSPCSTTSSMLESLPKQAVASDGSQSESEEQTVSIKTTLLSPEKPELEVTASIRTEEQSEEGNYSDSFESDEKSKEGEECEERLAEQDETLIEDEEKTEEAEDAQTGKEKEIEEVEVEVEVEEEEEEEEEAAEAEEDGEEEEEEKEEAAEEEAEEEGTIDGMSSVETDEVTEEATPEDATRLVDFITESVLHELMAESVTVVMGGLKKAEDRRSEDRSVEALTNMIASEIVSEVINDALGIYLKKKRTSEKTQDVRQRIQEIMSQAPGTLREQRRPQDMMVTTYDVPIGTQDAKESNSPEREEFLQSLSPKSQEKQFKIEVSNLEAGSQADVDGQEWFDDDFGLSRTRREAEELRVQQIQIEQEIQQLQAEQEQAVYYYLRQIPNKPPPPYTPPGTAATERFTSEREITGVISRAVRYLTDEMGNGKDLGDIGMPEPFFNPNDNEHVKCYKVFLFDLAKHIISDIVGVEFEESKLPWMRTNEKLSKFKIKKVERTYECLFKLVMDQVLVLFGFRQKMEKERLIVKWSRKKRDHVDEILVGESQEEESEWTNYDEDEVTVKNNITLSILDSLIDETAQILNGIWIKRTRMAN